MNAKARQQIDRCIIKLDLHIGTEKTGTTSFQHWLKANQAQLEGQGIIRPAWPKKFLPDINHRMLAVYAQGFSPFEDGQKSLKLDTPEAHAALCATFEKTFEKEVAQRGAGRWIMSAEHLHSRLSEGAQVARLASLLRRFFKDITVHIHMRPQVELAKSIASTGIRQGGTVASDYFDRVTPENSLYNYEALVARWAQVFGPRNLRLIPYKRQPSIGAYFLKLWGLDAAGFSAMPTLNRALDWRVMALHNTLSPYLENMPESLFLNDLADSLPFEAALCISWDMAQDITERMRPSNQELVQAYPALTLADLTPNPEDYTAPETLSRLNPQCDFAPQAAAALVELQCRLILEQTRTATLRAEKAYAAGRPNKAKTMLEEAATQILVLKPRWGARADYRALQKHIANLLIKYKS